MARMRFTVPVKAWRAASQFRSTEMPLPAAIPPSAAQASLPRCAADTNCGLLSALGKVAIAPIFWSAIVSITPRHASVLAIISTCASAVAGGGWMPSATSIHWSKASMDCASRPYAASIASPDRLWLSAAAMVASNSSTASPIALAKVWLTSSICRKYCASVSGSAALSEGTVVVPRMRFNTLLSSPIVISSASAASEKSAPPATGAHRSGRSSNSPETMIGGPPPLSDAETLNECDRVPPRQRRRRGLISSVTVAVSSDGMVTRAGSWNSSVPESLDAARLNSIGWSPLFRNSRS